MSDLLPLLGAAVALALANVLHCVGMCGAFAIVARGRVEWHLGKGLSYTLLGGSAGAMGAALTGLLSSPWASFAVGALCAGALLLSAWRLLAPSLSSGAGPAHRGARLLRPVLRLLLPAKGAEPLGAGGRFSLGLASGFVPCGAVYAALTLAAASATPLRGALVMACFGLTTVPTLILVGRGSPAIGRWLGVRPRIRLAAAATAVLVALGVLLYRLPPLLSAGDGVVAAPACHEQE